MRKALLINLLMLLIATLVPTVSYASGIQRTTTEEDFEKSKAQWEKIYQYFAIAEREIVEISSALNYAMDIFPNFAAYSVIKDELENLNLQNQQAYENYVRPYCNSEKKYTGGYTDDIYETGYKVIQEIYDQTLSLDYQFRSQNPEALNEYCANVIQTINAFNEGFNNLGIDLGVFDKLIWKIETINVYNGLEHIAEQKESIDKLDGFANNIVSLQRYMHSAKLNVSGLQNSIECFPLYTDDINELNERLGNLINETLGNNVDIDNELDKTYQIAETETMWLSVAKDLWIILADAANTEEQRMCFVMYANDYLYSFAPRYLESLIIENPTHLPYIQSVRDEIDFIIRDFAENANHLDHLTNDGFINFVALFDHSSYQIDSLLDLIDNELSSENNKSQILSLLDATNTDLEQFRTNLVYSQIIAQSNFVPYVEILIDRLYNMRFDIEQTDDENILNQIVNELVYIQKLLLRETDLAHSLGNLNDAIDSIAHMISNPESSLQSDFNNLYLDFISFTESYKNDNLLEYSNIESKLDEIAYQLAIFEARYNQLYYAIAGVDGITDDISNCNVRYLSIDGVEIKNPEKGQLVIRVDSSGKASKIHIK